MTVKINIVIVKIIIITQAVFGPTKEKGEMFRYLRRFATWQKEKNEDNDIDGPQHWDHAIMFSGFDFHLDSPADTGLTYISGMCDEIHSASVVEGLSMESVYSVSHELGHSLGMEHDGHGNDCSPRTHLMSPNMGPGKIAWSECSNKYLQDFLRKEDASCLNDPGPSLPKLDYHTEELPGTRYPANAQCRLKFGKKSTAHMTKDKPFDDICRVLWCNNGTHTKRAHPALEGTKCGKGRICVYGKCLLKTDINNAEEFKSNSKK